jgi:hypothetical protein
MTFKVTFLQSMYRTNVIKLFTVAVCRHSIVIESFCVVKLFTLEITMEWHLITMVKKFITFGHGDKL